MKRSASPRLYRSRTALSNLTDREDKVSESADIEQETHLSDTVDYYIIRRQKVKITQVMDDFDISFV